MLVVAALVAATLGAASPASATVLPGFHQLMNRQSAECLDVTGAARYNGAEVRVWRCVGASNQLWQPVATSGSSLVQLQVQHTGKCLTIQGEAVRGANIVQDVCVGSSDQLWNITPAPDGWSEVRSLLQDVIGGSTVPMCLDKAGSDVTVWPCHSGWWQHWNSLG
ncbi:RICIN domain-containing protein [Geodermatophilus siccatus]|nr:RICIN domain-containing protein [Geodermatophilus siccatus]